MNNVWMRAGESSSARRRLLFDVRGSDGLTPALTEGGGQPQISINGSAWTDDGIGALVSIGAGRYYAELDIGSLAVAGDRIATRYQSAGTAECAGETARVVAIDLNDGSRFGLSSLPTANPGTAGGVAVAGEWFENLDSLAIALGAIVLTCESGSPSSITFTSDAPSGDGELVGCWLRPPVPNGSGLACRRVVGYVGSTRTATIHPPLLVAPAADDVFLLIPTGPVDSWYWLGSLLSGSPTALMQSALDSRRLGELAAQSMTSAPASGSLFGDLTEKVGSNPRRFSALALAEAPSASGSDPLAQLVPGGYPSGSAGAALGRLSAGRITTVSAMSADGRRLSLVAGDDYHVVDARALEFDGSEAGWPSLVDADLTWRCHAPEIALVIEAMVVDPGSSPRVVVELSSAQTALLPAGRHPFDLLAVLANGHRVTLAMGQVTVSDRIGLL